MKNPHVISSCRRNTYKPNISWSPEETELYREKLAVRADENGGSLKIRVKF
jgi:hypothetical protein